MRVNWLLIDLTLIADLFDTGVQEVTWISGRQITFTGLTGVMKNRLERESMMRTCLVWESKRTNSFPRTSKKCSHPKVLVPLLASGPEFCRKTRSFIRMRLAWRLIRSGSCSHKANVTGSLVRLGLHEIILRTRPHPYPHCVNAQWAAGLHFYKDLDLAVFSFIGGHPNSVLSLRWLCGETQSDW